MLFGSIPSEAETFAVQGKDYPRRNPRESIRRGMGFVPGDRAHFGSVRPMTARENVTLPELKSLTGPLGSISASRGRAYANQSMAQYDLKPPRDEPVLGPFTGGNQTKTVYPQRQKQRRVEK